MTTNKHIAKEILRVGTIFRLPEAEDPYIVDSVKKMREKEQLYSFLHRSYLYLFKAVTENSLRSKKERK